MDDIKEFWENGKVEYDGKTWIVMVALLGGALGASVYDMVKQHRESTTGIGIAKRKWFVAEDEKRLYCNKKIKEFGKDYDFKADEKYEQLRLDTEILWKTWKLMLLNKKLVKISNQNSRKAKKLKIQERQVETY